MTRPARRTAAPLRYRSVAASHIGGRLVNEDRFLERPEAGLWAVADGMGGHQAGEVAAGMVVDALGGIAPSPSGYAHLNAVSEALEAVNAALIARAASSAADRVIGSTVVTLLVHDGYYACLWAGDSRAYLYRSGRLAQITRDHSLVQEMVDAGALSPQQARIHPRANVVTRAVGAAPSLEPEVLHAAVQPGDIFLLCSDGLTNAIADAELAAALQSGALEPAAAALMHLARERAAPDNVTLVLIRAD